MQPWACDPNRSRGRQHPEPAAPERNAFGRDRDRIVHSSAFRRLEYKTQVFVNHEGDLFRTRLTHSIEVAQIARSIARALGADEDLTEAIALAHDLGHTPFGHAGQDALNACMKDDGGFEHNLQSLRVVDELEERYAEFDGLNLTYETREGILKHCSIQNARTLGELGLRFIHGRQPGLEAQIANLADEIAYNHHDVDDGLRSGFLTLEQLDEVDLFAEQVKIVRVAYPGLQGRRLINEALRRIINRLIVDLTQSSRERLRALGPSDVDEVRDAPPLVGFSEPVAALSAHLKAFLLDALYRHFRVLRMASKARRIVADLYAAFSDDVRLLPIEYQVRIDRTGLRARVIADYIAGMTDRYAIREHRKLFDIEAT